MQGLFVGEGETQASEFVNHYIVTGNKIARMSVDGKATLGVLTDMTFNFGNGFFLTPGDFINAIFFGFLTKGTEKLMGVKTKTEKNITAFRNGFLIGGIAGNIDQTLWTLECIADNKAAWGTGTDNMVALNHSFLKILVFGGIAGLVNVGLTWMLK